MRTSGPSPSAVAVPFCVDGIRRHAAEQFGTDRIVDLLLAELEQLRGVAVIQPA